MICFQICSVWGMGTRFFNSSAFPLGCFGYWILASLIAVGSGNRLCCFRFLWKCISALFSKFVRVCWSWIFCVCQKSCKSPNFYLIFTSSPFFRMLFIRFIFCWQFKNFGNGSIPPILISLAVSSFLLWIWIISVTLDSL